MNDDADAGQAVEEESPVESTLADRVAEYDEALAAEVEAVEAHERELEAEVADLREEVDETEERLKRVQADFQNYKKRAKKRQEQMEERATEDLVTRLLDVYDNLERALAEESGDYEGLKEGVKLTKGEFERVLENEGVEEIRPEEGAETDPERHEVMMQVESDAPAGTVAEVYRPGYEMGEKVLRPAQVTVSSRE
ncbi:nucleotide exchange factor GrpE [Halocalculus aciditolerans]|uniref:Protein GrpE n=1 Tax=Halocalculus aciditolerans TaxID=1383812 RepID=A0A830F7I4_9EURY|nr:nucleotide exchange factor GrpE [Halocalculus aciditolerans]GGL62072.1 hypothetical protein GCM10009039_20320 [Halocalculus aciditolerans]